MSNNDQGHLIRKVRDGQSLMIGSDVEIAMVLRRDEGRAGWYLHLFVPKNVPISRKVTHRLKDMR